MEEKNNAILGAEGGTMGAEPKGKKTPNNANCPCGSGRKYKKCCKPKDMEIAAILNSPKNTFRDQIENEKVSEEELLMRDGRCMYLYLTCRKAMLAADRAHSQAGIHTSEDLVAALVAEGVCEGREAIMQDTKKQIELLEQARDRSKLSRPEELTLALLSKWDEEQQQGPNTDE